MYTQKSKTLLKCMKNMTNLEKDLAKKDGALCAKWNNGVYVTTNGHAYDINGNKIDLLESEMGYYYVPGSYLNKSSVVESDDLTGQKTWGQYIFKMVVFSFGDRNGIDYTENCVIDHIDMDHANNMLFNLQVVNEYVNLSRAARATNSPACIERYNTKMIELLTNSPEYYKDVREMIKFDIMRFGNRPIIEGLDYFDVTKNGGESEE